MRLIETLSLFYMMCDQDFFTCFVFLRLQTKMTTIPTIDFSVLDLLPPNLHRKPRGMVDRLVRRVREKWEKVFYQVYVVCACVCVCVSVCLNHLFVLQCQEDLKYAPSADSAPQPCSNKVYIKSFCLKLLCT
jgi:hypothetical protein